MNDINVRNEILDSIDNLNQVTMESTFEVFGSLLNACDKASMITEYSNSEDLSMFSIFQEAEVKEGDTKANAEAKKNSFGYKLIHFIPNLLKKLWAFIKSAWNGITTPESAKPKGGLAGILEKIKGVSIDKIKENPAAYGIPAALVTTVLAIVGISNGEKIKGILSKWSNGIKAFWVATKLAPYIAFEGGSFTTNIKKEGLLDTFKKLKTVLDQTNAITQRIASKGGSAKEIMAEMDKIIKSAQDLQQNPTFLTGENIVEESDTFIDLINKVKDVYDGFTQQNPVDINATAKPMFEDNGLEASFIAEAEKKCTVLSKIANGIAVFFTATSTAFIGFIKWIGECLGLVKKANAELDGSGASVKMEDQSKDESSGEESAEDENANKDIPGKDTTPISNEEVDKAVVAAQENPSKETIVNALDKTTELFKDVNLNDNGKNIQVIRDVDVPAAVKQVKNAVTSGKVPADKGTAKKVATVARRVDDLIKVATKENPSKEEVAKVEGRLKEATRVASIQNEKGEVSEEDKANGQLKTKNAGERYIFKTDGELMSFLNKHLGEGNPVVSANLATGTIKMKTGHKGKEQKFIKRETPGLQKLVASVGNINKGSIRWNKNTWIVEFAEDELDECIMMLEGAIMECLNMTDTFVVEYADDTTEEMTSFIMEAYDEEVSAEEAAFEEINNHWYR